MKTLFLILSGLFLCIFSAQALELKPDKEGVASGAVCNPEKVWYLNGIGGRWLAVGQPNTLNRRDRVTFRIPIDRFIPSGRVRKALLVFAYSAGGKQQRINQLELEHFNVERLKLSGNDLISHATSPVAKFTVQPVVKRPVRLTFDVTAQVNSDLRQGFGFTTFRIRSVTADQSGNTAMKSSFVTIEQNSMKLLVTP